MLKMPLVCAIQTLSKSSWNSLTVQGAGGAGPQAPPPPVPAFLPGDWGQLHPLPHLLHRGEGRQVTSQQQSSGI